MAGTSVPIKPLLAALKVNTPAMLASATGLDVQQARSMMQANHIDRAAAIMLAQAAKLDPAVLWPDSRQAPERTSGLPTLFDGMEWVDELPPARQTRRTDRGWWQSRVAPLRAAPGRWARIEGAGSSKALLERAKRVRVFIGDEFEVEVRALDPKGKHDTPHHLYVRFRG